MFQFIEKNKNSFTHKPYFNKIIILGKPLSTVIEKQLKQ